MPSPLSPWAKLRALLARARGNEPRVRLQGAERVAHVVAVLGCVWFTLVTFWESFGPARSGHYSTSAAYAMAGENMVIWHKFAMYAGYLSHAPTPDQYYCHHPYGIGVLEAIAYLIFGHHWFTTRAPAIFCSTLSAVLVYGLGRRAWGVIPAAAATLFFIFIPIELSFATFSNLEQPTIAFGLLFAWATGELWATWKTRYVYLSAIGALGACNGDWAGFVFVGPVLVFGFLRAYVLPRRWYGRIDEKTYAKWFAYAAAMTVGTLVLYILLFGKADKMNDLMGSYHTRSGGSEVPISDVFSQRRKLWLGTLLTPIAYGAIGAGVPLALVRIVKKPLEIFTIAWFLSASFQYFIFKQGADIHIFWPHYYAASGALATGTLTASLMAGRDFFGDVAELVTRRPRVLSAFKHATAAIVGAFIGVPLVILARHGIPELVQARKTAGRFDQGGQLMATEADMADFARWAYADVATAGSTVQVMAKYEYGFASEYGGDRPYVTVSSITAAKPEDPQRYTLVDTRKQPEKELDNIVKQFGVQAVGSFWRVDRAQKGPMLMAHRYIEKEPNPLEWFFLSGTDLVYKIQRDEDPWVTWELRDAFGVPAPPPDVAPNSADERRIAYNVAIEQGDTAEADHIRGELAGKLGNPANIEYTGGVKLLGIDLQPGPALVVTLYWETDASYKKADVSFSVKCKVVAPPKLWFSPVDYFEREMAPVPVLRPGNWKPRHLYAQRFIALHRIGKEECTGGFTGSFTPKTPMTAPLMTFN
jgi:4-amino-4-deoxy-L-arabinose transferase-like glycosyltransferase